MDAASIVDKLSREAGRIAFADPVRYVYNPLEYARAQHLEYWRKFGAPPKRAVLLGMNPGPWGMAQTGVPFGEVKVVGGWLGIGGEVGRPANEHPRRKVEGFGCKRSEVSGFRLWGWAMRRFVTPERFFSEFFVANYCPLMFMEESGSNRTPDKLGVAERRELESVCDEALVETVRLLGAGSVVGIGAYAEAAARRVFAGTGVGVGRITHPSPANPAANRGWEELAERELGKLGLI